MLHLKGKRYNMISKEVEEHWKAEVENSKKAATFQLAEKLLPKINDANLYLQREFPDIYQVSRLLNEVKEILEKHHL